MRSAMRSPLRRLSGAVAVLPYTLDIDLTSSLDSRITFTRAGARNYINAGVLTALATGLPAFESWDGVNRGLAIEPGFTNLLKHSNDFTNAVWTYTGASTAVAGDAGSGVMTQLSMVAATATTSTHMLRQKPGSQAAGLVQTYQGFVKAASGATNYSCYLRASNEFNNNGLVGVFRLDGSDGWFPVQDATMLTGGMFWYRKLAGGVYMVGITGTWVSTGNKQVEVGVTANAAPAGLSYTAVTTEKVQMFGLSLATTPGPHGYVATGAATASQAAESAIFNDTSWLTSTAEGTFVIEHDCWSGPIIGSGANTVLAATVPGKTAIAWSGVTSDTVNNGGSATSSTQPTFSGSDVRLLSTSGATNCGHIKSIRFYPTRLSVAELQSLTAPTVVSTANPGALRTVSVDNRLPTAINTTVGSALTFKSRFRVKLGAHACSELQLDFPNIRWAGVAVGNALNIAKVSLERVTTVAEFAPVTVSASRSFTIADGANTTVLSDVILPSAFTGLTEFPANTEFWVRIEGSVTTAGHIIMGCRQSETGGWGRIYNPATASFSDVDGTGAITLLSGSDPGQLTQSYMPILVGKFVSGDPKTLFVVGDSIIEGTGSLGTTGTFVNLACRNLGLPKLEMSQGGQSQLQAAATAANWTPYLKYCRVLLDEFGTNNVNAVLDFFTYWEAAKTTHGYDKLIRLGLFPRTTSTDSWATEANQTIARAYPTTFPDLSSIQWLKYGLIDYNIDPQSVRGVNLAKWKVTGAAFYSTTDGTHQSGAGNDLLAAEVEPILSAVTVT